MPRKPSQKPWLHAPKGYWCATVDGRRVYLDRDYPVAVRKLRQLRTEQKRNSGVVRNWLDATFAELADEFLSDLKARRKATTYDQARHALLRALRVLGSRIRVVEIRRIHLAKIEQALAGKKSPITVRDTIAKVQQVFSWAVEHELLESSPLVGYRKPAKRSRTRVITPDEFQALLRACPRNPAFRRVLIALRLTGCRPGELRSLPRGSFKTLRVRNSLASKLHTVCVERRHTWSFPCRCGRHVGGRIAQGPGRPRNRFSRIPNGF